MTVIPVEVGQLRRHPKGHTLRIVKIYHEGYRCSVADCVPDPPIKGRRATRISFYTLFTYPIVTPTTEPTP